MASKRSPPSSRAGSARTTLDPYFDKRHEGTNEPFGGDGAEGPTLEGAFVVHLHDATRLHYDLRIQMRGALASFAVPRGFPLDPDDKRFAINTEDHPLEYLDFEDVIPEGNYGAGAMIVWDRGWVRYLEGPAEDEHAAGKIDMFLSGYKLRGRWALVRLKGPRATAGNEWILIKKRDGTEAPGRDVGAELPRSVLSGLTVAERARAAEVGASLVARAAATAGARRGGPKARRAFVRDVEGAPVPPDAVFDLALGGARVLVDKEGDAVSVLYDDGSAAGVEVADMYPEVVRAARAMAAPSLSVDGELVAFDDAGRPSLARLGKRLTRLREGDAHGAVHASGLQLVCHDLLSVGDVDVTGCDLVQRRALLGEIVPETPGVARAATLLAVTEAEARALVRAHDLPGLVAKSRRSPYDPTRAGWVRLDEGPPKSRATLDHGGGAARPAVRAVQVTNPHKVFWPEDGLTKGDLIAYYTRIAPAILPYLRDRPVILVRYPDGIHGKSFFQWNVPPAAPAWLRTITFRDHEDGREKRGFLVDDGAALAFVANLACIPIHVLACRTRDFAAADFFTVDFDVKQGRLSDAITLARVLGEWLEGVGLPGYPKTSGQTGLHVLVPLGPGHGFDTARGLADLLGRLLVSRYPDIATMERAVGRRGERVYVDTGQTGPARSIVAPYSVRASPGARVSTPLEWSEVSSTLDPARFDVRTVPERFEAAGDPMRGLLTARPDVPRAIAELEKLAARLA